MDEFVTSLDISEHPLMKARKKTKLLYFTALEHFVNLCPNTEYTNARLSLYRNSFLDTEKAIILTDKNLKKTVNAVVNDFLKPWKRERCFMLLSDIALIVTDKTAVKKASDLIAMYLRNKKKEKLKELLEILYNDKTISPGFDKTQSLILQFCANRSFLAQKQMRVIVTATMSAGKSTLINALVGKPVTRAAQEACTTNLCFLYNKPFEDGHIHLLASPVRLNATYDELKTSGKDTVCSIASFFRALENQQVRICLIDTPGSNSALNLDHGMITQKAIVEENYDKLIYVLNACPPGTDDEIKHLKYVYKNVPYEKVIFVLNKLDNFDNSEDSISESIEGVKRDLEKIGFKKPIVCPFSAYFSYLLKMKLNNDKLNKKKQDNFDFNMKVFNEPEYDLSVYYDNSVNRITHNGGELLNMGIKSGLYGLEKILYGETIK